MRVLCTLWISRNPWSGSIGRRALGSSFAAGDEHGTLSTSASAGLSSGRWGTVNSAASLLQQSEGKSSGASKKLHNLLETSPLPSIAAKPAVAEELPVTVPHVAAPAWQAAEAFTVTSNPSAQVCESAGGSSGITEPIPISIGNPVQSLSQRQPAQNSQIRLRQDEQDQPMEQRQTVLRPTTTAAQNPSAQRLAQFAADLGKDLPQSFPAPLVSITKGQLTRRVKAEKVKSAQPKPISSQDAASSSLTYMPPLLALSSTLTLDSHPPPTAHTSLQQQQDQQVDLTLPIGDALLPTTALPNAQPSALQEQASTTTTTTTTTLRLPLQKSQALTHRASQEDSLLVDPQSIPVTLPTSAAKQGLLTPEQQQQLDQIQHQLNQLVQEKTAAVATATESPHGRPESPPESLAPTHLSTILPHESLTATFISHTPAQQSTAPLPQDPASASSHDVDTPILTASEPLTAPHRPDLPVTDPSLLSTHALRTHAAAPPSTTTTAAPVHVRNTAVQYMQKKLGVLAAWLGKFADSGEPAVTPPNQALAQNEVVAQDPPPMQVVEHQTMQSPQAAPDLITHTPPTTQSQPEHTTLSPSSTDSLDLAAILKGEIARAAAETKTSVEEGLAAAESADPLTSSSDIDEASSAPAPTEPKVLGPVFARIAAQESGTPSGGGGGGEGASSRFASLNPFTNLFAHTANSGGSVPAGLGGIGGSSHSPLTSLLGQADVRTAVPAPFSLEALAQRMALKAKGEQEAIQKATQEQRREQIKKQEAQKRERLEQAEIQLKETQRRQRVVDRSLERYRAQNAAHPTPTLPHVPSQPAPSSIVTAQAREHGNEQIPQVPGVTVPLTQPTPALPSLSLNLASTLTASAPPPSPTPPLPPPPPPALKLDSLPSLPMMSSLLTSSSTSADLQQASAVASPLSVVAQDSVADSLEDDDLLMELADLAR